MLDRARHADENVREDRIVSHASHNDRISRSAVRISLTAAVFDPTQITLCGTIVL